MAPLQPPSRTTRQSPVTNRKNPSPSKKSPPVSHVPPSARGWTRSTPSSTTMGAARIVNVGPPRPVVPMPRRSSLKKPSPPNKLLADRPRSLSASDVSVVRFIDGVTINRTYSKDEYDRSVIEVDALTEMDRVVYALFKSSLPVGVDCPSVGKSVLKVDVPSGLVGRSGDQISAAVGAGPEREASCVDALIFVFPDLNGLPSLANNLMEKAEQCARSVVRGW
ncbi:hypothetical protein DFJ73DRAFT_283387 [Zopfochytrium polystomum]|nr:hypothetical protein DFJ73DRAFT_283387 [Zopfochytrium polystomum]